jgi:hypothetical protein
MTPRRNRAGTSEPAEAGVPLPSSLASAVVSLTANWQVK